MKCAIALDGTLKKKKLMLLSTITQLNKQSGYGSVVGIGKGEYSVEEHGDSLWQ